jgi:hypothetical protein
MFICYLGKKIFKIKLILSSKIISKVIAKTRSTKSKKNKENH